MQPAELQPADFKAYPPEAKALVTQQLELLRALPLSFLPLLLREVQDYDWKFPVERREIDKQFEYLSHQTPGQLASTMQPFQALHLTADLAQSDWVNEPTPFSEKLSAFLWATQQMDAFRKASVDYVHAMNAAQESARLSSARLAVILIGRGVNTNSYPLFRKLRPRGVYYTGIAPEGGVEAITQCLTKRAADYPDAFAHWYVDGAEGKDFENDTVASIAYAKLKATRVALVNRMIQTMKPGGGGPEVLRTDLARLKPSEVGLPDQGRDAIMSRFQLSLLTQGSGTQIFSTTFVQWSAREILRRAQPLTLVARYAPRQKDAEVREIAGKAPPLDPAASLIDADMGAYYTWINQQRLSGRDQARFLVWFEEHREAVVCAPGFKAGTVQNQSVAMRDLIGQLT